ncbi:MAG TPA: L,D-transpeptidase [Bacteroidales bacterium]|nr:L,D-transpeptidase [Bacteroidales bacterium]
MESEEILTPLPQPEIKGKSELYQLVEGFFKRIFLNTFLRKTLKIISVTILVILSVFFIFSLFVYIIPGITEFSFTHGSVTKNDSELRSDKQYKAHIAALGKDVQKISRKFAAYTPGQSYLVINTTDNRFSLYRNKKLIREGFCSSGSYTHLTSAEGTRHWIFKTPKGKFWIQQKITKPLWKRPDWSFVEEGLPIPSPDDPSRYEMGVLGDYAMSLGDGYLIHGTIYKRFLGMPVTHGCVRLNDDDLEAIFKTLSLGSKVYIF